MADQKPKRSNALFEALVVASGLSPIFARSTIKRALERVGVNVETMTRADMEKAWPSVKRVMETFLPPGHFRMSPGDVGGGDGGPSGAADVFAEPSPRRGDGGSSGAAEVFAEPSRRRGPNDSK